MSVSFPSAPIITVRTAPKSGLPVYSTACPWCASPCDDAISWVALWRDLSEHFFSAHRAEQDELKARWRAATAPQAS